MSILRRPNAARVGIDKDRLAAGSVRSPKRPRSQFSFSVLSCVFMVEAVVFWALVKTQPDVQLAVSYWLPGHPTSVITPVPPHDPARDPRVGMPAPVWSLETANGALTQADEFRGRKVVLLFIGRCSSCALKGVGAWMRLPDLPNPPVVLMVASDSPENLRWASHQVGSKVRFLRDADGDVARAYNADWTPRAYLIDEQGVLRYRQSGYDATETALRRARVWLRQSRGATDRKATRG